VDVDPEFLAPLAQDGQQALAADRGKAVPAGRDHVAAVVDVDVVRSESRESRSVERGVRLLDSPQSSSENTTPKPNVSSAALRSQTSIRVVWIEELFTSVARYRPAAPPQ